jgi:hypothetical protein
MRKDIVDGGTLCECCGHGVERAGAAGVVSLESTGLVLCAPEGRPGDEREGVRKGGGEAAERERGQQAGVHRRGRRKDQGVVVVVFEGEGREARVRPRTT